MRICWQRVLVCGAALLPAHDLVARPLTIERMAPEEAVLVVAVDAPGKAWEQFRETPVGRMLRDAAFDPWRSRHAPADELAERLPMVAPGARRLPVPHGPIGYALFPNDKDWLTTLITVDFGPGIEQANRVLDALLDDLRRAPEQTEDAPAVETRRDKALTVHRLRWPATRGFDFPVRWLPPELSSIAVPMVEHFRLMDDDMHIARVGSHVLISPDYEAVMHAARVVSGEQKTNGFDEDKAIRKTAKVLKHPDVTILARPTELARRLASMDGGWNIDTTAWAAFHAAKLLGGPDAAGLGLNFDVKHHRIHATAMVHLPDDAGRLSSLLDLQTPRKLIPPFVGADAVEYARLNVRLPGVAPMIAECDALLEHAGPLSRAVTTLGTEVHLVSNDRHSALVVHVEHPEDAQARIPTLLGADPVGAVVAQHAMYAPKLEGAAAIAAALLFGGEAPVLAFGRGAMLLGNEELVVSILGDEGPAVAFTENLEYAQSLKVLRGGKAVAWGLALPSELRARQAGRPLLAGARADAARDAAGEQGAVVTAEPWAGGGAESSAVDREKPTACSPAMLDRYLGPLVWQVQRGKEGFMAEAYLLQAYP